MLATHISTDAAFLAWNSRPASADFSPMGAATGIDGCKAFATALGLAGIDLIEGAKACDVYATAAVILTAWYPSGYNEADTRAKLIDPALHAR